jgi:glucose/arabinose dehydrogenase
MKPRMATLAAVLLLTAGCGGATSTRAASAGSLVAIGSGLQGRTGGSATVYARGLPKVAAFAFDPEGRLWVATADYLDSGHDGLYLLARAEAAPLEVVTGLHTPLGLLWYRGSLYVSSASRVDAFSGFDGTAFQSRRSVVTFPAGVGEVNSLALSPAGRLELGISAPCDHCVPTGPWSAAVVSFLPDGSDPKVDARGIRAPVGWPTSPRPTTCSSP